MSYTEIEPASAKAGKDIDWNKLEQRVENKLDGWRFLMHFGGKLDRTYMTGRRISSKTGKFSEKGLCAPHLSPATLQCGGHKLGYTVIDGEVMPPVDRTFADIAGIMNVEPGKAATRIVEIGKPMYYAFDILFYDGKDVRTCPLKQRLVLLQAVLRTSFVDQKLVYEAPHHHHEGGRTSAEDYYTHIVETGGEGVIVKDLEAPYGKGWMKLKRFSTIDAVIMGYTDAEHGVTGKYVGLIGAVKVGVYKGKELVEIGQVSGFDDELRRKLSKYKDKHIGTVMEILAQEMAKDRLRHPRFSRLRPEASIKDATWAKMMTDLKAAK